ncbi:MAG: hypothetical protein RJA70_4258 [Pseudomonadota bacterium]|jgi:hypothetical protein
MSNAPAPAPFRAAKPLEVAAPEPRTLSSWNETTGEARSITLEGPVTAFRLQTVQRDRWYDRVGTQTKLFGKLAFGCTLLLVIYKTDFRALFGASESRAIAQPPSALSKSAPHAAPAPPPAIATALSLAATPAPPDPEVLLQNSQLRTAGPAISHQVPKNPQGLAGSQPRAEMPPRVSPTELPPDAPAQPSTRSPGPSEGSKPVAETARTPVAVAPKVDGFRARVPRVRLGSEPVKPPAP